MHTSNDMLRLSIYTCEVCWQLCTDLHASKTCLQRQQACRGVLQHPCCACDCLSMFPLVYVHAHCKGTVWTPIHDVCVSQCAWRGRGHNQCRADGEDPLEFHGELHGFYDRHRLVNFTYFVLSPPVFWIHTVCCTDQITNSCTYISVICTSGSVCFSLPSHKCCSTTCCLFLP